MRAPIIVVNLKTYPEVCGRRGMELARLCASAADRAGKEVAIAPQQCDLALIAGEVSIPVLAQHVDCVSQGATTGYVTPEAVREAGCAGTLLNHSEHRLRGDEIKLLVGRCMSIGLETIVCTSTVGMTRAKAHFEPDFIAIEPPDLIGGDISVTSAQPEVVAGAVDAVRRISPNVQVLCGAGVKTPEDVAKAMELGARGVLLASGIVSAKDPMALLTKMLDAL
ncbi:MAG: triose-phosphate isomerase [Candidatus Thermoplasmatota archaeon]